MRRVLYRPQSSHCLPPASSRDDGATDAAAPADAAAVRAAELAAAATRVQGWLKVPIEEGDDLIEEGDDLIEEGDDLDDENDEAMAPVEERNYTEYDRYVRTYNPQMNVPEAQQLVPGSIAIDVGDYYVAIDGQVLRAIGTLMMATDDIRGPLHDMFCCRPCCSQAKLMRLVEHSVNRH